MLLFHGAMLSVQVARLCARTHESTVTSTGVRREIYMESFPFTGTSNTTRSAKCQAEGLPSLKPGLFPALSPNQAASLFMSPNIWIRAVFSSVGYAAYGV